ncbi:sodium:solute symporter [Lacipirellula sp.]|uniref:sodium:solute symporter n=1 Tax=Lacipirellula sp. TaxID=2691419 RepID=UPI003D14442C
METLDWVVVGLYFMSVAGLAWWVIQKNKGTATDYFLAGRHLPWFLVGASIFASNIGSEHVVGLAGSGATDGVALAHYELHAWCLLVLAWVMVPFYMRSMVYTMPEFLERRFSTSARYMLSIISLVLFIISKVAVGIFAGGVVFRTLLPKLSLDLGFMVMDSFWIGSILVLILTGIYTMLGGMRAVVYTEALQTIILVVGSALCTIFGLKAIGGWEKLRETVGDEMFNLWKPIVPEGVEGTWAPEIVKDSAGEVVRQAWYFNGDYPWLGMMICAPVIGLWYWCTCQYIVQRALGAKDEREARRGSIFAGMLKLLPVFLFIIPGIIAFGLAKTGTTGMTGMIGPDGKAIAEQAQSAFPQMVLYVLPLGVRGIVVAGLLAALMSSLAGVFNASSTLFTMDIYQKYRPESSQAHLVWVGRMATVVMVLIGIAWIPVIKGAKGLYDYLQGVQGYLAPPIFVVFFLGVFWKRLNAKGCMAAMLVGFALGIFRLVVDTPVSLKLKGYENGYTPDSFLWIVNNIYFQYFSILILLASMIAMIVVSYATAPPDERQIEGLTFATVTDEQKRESRASWSAVDVVSSVAVLAAIVAAYLYFTG